jgi:hypothetical protein
MPNRTAKQPNRTDEGPMRTPNRNSSSLDVLRSWLGTMPCVGSQSVWSSLRGEAITTSKIGEYGLLTGLSSPGMGLVVVVSGRPSQADSVRLVTGRLVTDLRCMKVAMPNRTAKQPNRTDEGPMRTPNRNSSSLDVLRSWLGTMPCVGSQSVWSSLRGEAMTTSKIGEYGLLTGLSLPGMGMLRSFEPHSPPKRPEASLYVEGGPRSSVPRVVSDGVSSNAPRQARV